MTDKERVKKLTDKLYKLNYWFCNEMLEEERRVAEFEKACEKAKESGEPTIIVSGSAHNAECMKSCMKDTVEVINFLRNEENVEYLETWQVTGVEAIFNQCHEDSVIPFDLPAALMAILGMWEKLEERLK